MSGAEREGFVLRDMRDLLVVAALHRVRETLMRHPIPIPADFAELARTTPNDHLAAHYGVSTKTIWRWSKAAGLTAKRTPAKPIPADFAEKARTLSIRKLAELYSTSETTVCKWRKAHGIGGGPSSIANAIAARLIPVPVDFADRAPGQSTNALCRIYGRTEKTVKRWRRETGIVAVAYVQPVKSRVVLPGRSLNRAPQLTGREQEAAQHLRRWAAVYRCAETGRAEANGTHWRIGNAIVSPSELIERAERRGWDPEEWRRVA